MSFPSQSEENKMNFQHWQRIQGNNVRELYYMLWCCWDI